MINAHKLVLMPPTLVAVARLRVIVVDVAVNIKIMLMMLTCLSDCRVRQNDEQ